MKDGYESSMWLVRCESNYEFWRWIQYFKLCFCGFCVSVLYVVTWSYDCNKQPLWQYFLIVPNLWDACILKIVMFPLVEVVFCVCSIFYVFWSQQEELVMGHSTSTTRIKTKKIAMLTTYSSTYNVTKKNRGAPPHMMGRWRWPLSPLGYITSIDHT